MVMETADDLRAMLDVQEFARWFNIGAGVIVAGVIDNNFDQSLDVNGRRTGVRCITSDISDLAVGQTITDITLETNYIVREKETGARTTLVILERT